MLDLGSFFTTGTDEVRQWTIRNGTKAPQAAGVIHGGKLRSIPAESSVADRVFQTSRRRLSSVSSTTMRCSKNTKTKHRSRLLERS